MLKSPRYAFVKFNKLCVLCFSAKHRCAECPSSSYSKFKCRCGKTHNYLLHFVVSKPQLENKLPSQNDVPSTDSKPTSSTQEEVKKSYSCTLIEEKQVVLLSSAIGKFKCGTIFGKARILLDSFSQATMISDSFTKKFKLPTYRSNSLIRGVGSFIVNIIAAIKLSIMSRFDDFLLNVEADVIPASCVTYGVGVSFPEEVINKLNHLKLAEPSLTSNNTHIGAVDVVIGA